MTVDTERIERAVHELLAALGEDPTRDGLVKTPHRVAKMYEELFAGFGENPADHLEITFAADHDEMVMVRDIPLFSSCEHHLIPFVGVAHVAYLPAERIIGLSKLARVVEHYSRDLQVQERLTKQVAACIQEHLSPKGVGVVLEAEHMCMSLRGVQKPGTRTVTSALHGLVRDDPRTREEFLSLTGGRR